MEKFIEIGGFVSIEDHIARYGSVPIWREDDNGEPYGQPCHAEPLDTDRDMFFPDWDIYGEAGDGFMNYAHELNGLDRMIVEDCACSGEHVQRFSMAIPTVSKDKRPEALSKKLDIDYDSAHRLITAWEVIDETRRIWPKFVDWTQKRGVKNAVEWFENTAAELSSVEYHDHELTGALPEIDANDVWLDRNGVEWVDTVSVMPDIFQLVNMNNEQATPITFEEFELALKAFWKSQPHPRRFARLCFAAQKAKTEDTGKIRAALLDKDRLKWLSHAQRSRLWAIVKGRGHELAHIRRQWVRQLAASMTAIEKDSLARIQACKSEKQARYYWHLLMSGGFADVRVKVSEHILKPALANRQRALAA